MLLRVEPKLEMSDRFLQVASTVTGTIAKLLYAPVSVTNGRGIIVTSSEVQQIGMLLDVQSHDALRIPIHYETENGEVIVGISCHPATLSPQLLQALVELIVQQTTAQTTSNHHELKDQFIHELLHYQGGNESIIINRAKQLGIDLSPPRAVILIDAASYILENSSDLDPQLLELRQRRRIQTIISSIISFFHLPNDTICADLGEGRVCVLKASDTKNLDLWVGCSDRQKHDSSWANLSALKRAADALRVRLHEDTGSAITIGIGRYHPGLEGLARSYEDARVALSLGNRLQRQNYVHCLSELGIAAFVGIADETVKIELAKYLLSPLDHEPELIATIEAFFLEDCCCGSTAKRLYIHRNTLTYRLEKIASLIGLDPRRFDDAVQIRLSLLLRSLTK
jgi:carbohydrate diacid regulator